MDLAKRIGLFGGGAICFALYYVTDVWGGRFETVSYGILCVVLVLVLATVLVFGDRQNAFGSGWLGRPLVFVRPVIFLSVLCLYAVLQDLIGYALATALALAGLLYLMKVRSPRILIALSGSLAVTSYLLFVELMGVPLPGGPFAF
ncbi:MAG: tripartite tricarboxylate transporter TctB family protein [Geminicoccaceae bacterium]